MAITLSNYSVRARVFATVLIGLVLMTAVGLLAITRLNRIDETVNNLAFNFALDQHLSDSMVSQILLSRFFANQYLRRPSSDTLDRFRFEFAAFEELLELASVKITKPERIEMLADIQSGVREYGLQFEHIVEIIAQRTDAVEGVLNVLGPRAGEDITSLRHAMEDNNDIVGLGIAADVGRSFVSARLNVFKYLEAGAGHWADAATADYKETFSGLKRLTRHASTEVVQAITVEIAKHQAGFEAVRVGFNLQNTIFDEKLNVIGPAVRITASKMSDSVGVDFAEASLATDELTIETDRFLIITIIFGAAIGLLLGYYVSRSITRPLNFLTTVADSLAAGCMQDLDGQDVHDALANIAQGKDEMAKIGKAYTALIGYFGDVVSDIVLVADGLAQGDLTIAPKAEYRGDFERIKTSLSSALTDLREVIADIVRVANLIAAGDLNVNTHANYRGDFEQVNKALGQAAANLSKATESNAEQDWLKTGLAVMNRELTGEQNIKSIAKNAVDVISKHISATAGIFYAVTKGENGSTQLSAIASYGTIHQLHDLESYEQIQFGEGLVGQAALERKTISKVHHDNERHEIRQSGFGLSVIKSIAISPFQYEDYVSGVVEVSSPNEFTALQVEFLEQAMPIIGVAVNTAESRASMQEVLAQSERQASQLQNNQQQLFDSNQELKE